MAMPMDIVNDVFFEILGLQMVNCINFLKPSCVTLSGGMIFCPRDSNSSYKKSRGTSMPNTL
ncbi:hypothetical protein Bca4012_000904 [Brassica carinata]